METCLWHRGPTKISQSGASRCSLFQGSGLAACDVSLLSLFHQPTGRDCPAVP